jgi:MFS family permease
LLTLWIALAQFMVGLGWNLCYIAGSSLLSDILAPGERGQVQGANDVIVNLVSATSSLSSGVILATLGFGTRCVLGAALAAIPLALVGWQGLTRTQLSTRKA